MTPPARAWIQFAFAMFLASPVLAQTALPPGHPPLSEGSRDGAPSRDAPERSNEADIDASHPERPAPPSLGSGAADGSGDRVTADSIRVTVSLVTADGAPIATPGLEVELVTMEPPHRIVRTESEETDAGGEAHFVVPREAGLEATARHAAESTWFSRTRIDLAGDAIQEATIVIQQTTDDSDEVLASNVMTIVEPWEEYLTFTQVWVLAVRGTRAFVSTGESEASGLRIPMPRGAVGITVVRPMAGRASVVGEDVWLRERVAPLGPDEEAAPSLIVRFSVPTEGASEVAWTQPLTVDVASASVVVPQETDFERVPELSVDLSVPICESSEEHGAACFLEVTSTANEAMLRPGLPVRVARGGRAEAGEEFRVRTSGWPAGPLWPRRAGLAGVAAGIAAGVFFWREHGRRSRPGAAEREPAVALRRSLMRAAAALDDAYDRGELTKRAWEAQRAGIRDALAGAHRRIRESATAPETPPLETRDRATDATSDPGSA